MTAREAFMQHYPEYLMEAAGLGLFMVSAAVFGTLIWHPSLPLSDSLGVELIRLLVMGTAMGLTAIGLIYSPWGKRSGAHLNPAVTLTMMRLRRIAPWDGFFYIVAQFLGGLAGVLLVSVVASRVLAAPELWYVPTVPGHAGTLAALFIETAMAAGLMAMVLVTGESKKLSSLTGVFAGIFLTTYITLGAPISGMSINPARTIASALPSGMWTAVWIYFVGPLVGMVLVGEIFRRITGKRQPSCAGMNRHCVDSCVFKCGSDYWQDRSLHSRGNHS
ncbi:MAG: aquaporin [Proteobacteria bacterium]|nr:aquaporin [Pseudomonadota bacterium]